MFSVDALDSSFGLDGFFGWVGFGWFVLRPSLVYSCFHLRGGKGKSVLLCVLDCWMLYRNV